MTQTTSSQKDKPQQEAEKIMAALKPLNPALSFKYANNTLYVLGAKYKDWRALAAFDQKGDWVWIPERTKDAV